MKKILRVILAFTLILSMSLSVKSNSLNFTLNGWFNPTSSISYSSVASFDSPEYQQLNWNTNHARHGGIDIEIYLMYIQKMQRGT